MDLEVQKSVTYLTEVETIAQDLLTERQEKLELSNAKNKFNEAFRELQKSEVRNSFVALDRTYFEFPKNVVMDLLKEDIDNATAEINKLHNSIKDKAIKLRDLEHQPKIAGIGLKPITGSEANAIHKAFGY